MVSLHSIFNMADQCLAYVNPEIRKIEQYPTIIIHLSLFNIHFFKICDYIKLNI